MTYQNKQEQTDLFMEEYNRLYNSIGNRVSKFIKRIFGGKKEKTLMLESGEEQEKESGAEQVDEKSRATKYKEQYYNPIDEQSIVKRLDENGERTKERTGEEIGEK